MQFVGLSGCVVQMGLGRTPEPTIPSSWRLLSSWLREEASEEDVL